MKNNLTITLALLLILSLNYKRSVAQNYVQNIKTFIQVWGFLKYHHEAVARGPVNWDSVFIAHISSAAKAKNPASLNAALTAVINAAGPVTSAVTPVMKGDIFTLNHDLKWLNNSKVINKQNKQILQFIFKRRNQGGNRFVSYKNATDYSGEQKFEGMEMPDENYRLLFLSRFWNAIAYFYPYKYLIGEDWNNVLSRFIPRIIASKDTLAYYKTFMRLSVSLHDGHSQFVSSKASVNDMVFGKYIPEVYVETLNNEVIVRKTGDNLTNKIIRGDLILSVDHKPIKQLVAERRQYVSASNENSKDHNLAWYLLATRKDHELLEIKRGNKVHALNVPCLLVSKRDWRPMVNYTSNGTGYKPIGNSIAYVYAGDIWHGTIDSILSFISRKKAVIFDVRNYPNNDDFYNIFHTFLSKPKIINLQTRIMPDNPGYFQWLAVPEMGDINQNVYKGKVIILVDARTQSQGEYSAMAFQTIPNAVTIGSQTAGCDGAVSAIPMGGSLTLSHSGYGIYYPDKRQTQQAGVKIDIYVQPTVQSISGGEDLILDEALKYLKKAGID